MNRLLWLLLPAVLVVASCRSGTKSKPSSEARAAADMATVEMAQKVPGPITQDPTVSVTGPATVYVLQANGLRAMLEWRLAGPGKIVVPLKENDSGARPLYWGVTSQIISSSPTSQWYAQFCVLCQQKMPSQTPCCPQ